MEDRIRENLQSFFEDILIAFIRAPLGVISNQLIAQDQHYLNDLDKNHPLILKQDKGVIACVKRLRQEEGTICLWQPFGFLLAERVWKRSVNYLFDDKPLFSDHDGEVTYRDIFKHTAKRFFKGLIDSLFCYPMEVLAVKYAAQFLPHEAGIVKKEMSFMTIYEMIVKKDGFTGLYHGFGLQIIIDLIFAFMTVMLEKIEHKGLPEKGKFHSEVVTAFVLSIFSLFPLDMITTRLQLQAGKHHKKVFSQIASDLFKKEGILGFYRLAILRFVNIAF